MELPKFIKYPNSFSFKLKQYAFYLTFNKILFMKTPKTTLFETTSEQNWNLINNKSLTLCSKDSMIQVVARSEAKTLYIRFTPTRTKSNFLIVSPVEVSWSKRVNCQSLLKIILPDWLLLSHPELKSIIASRHDTVKKALVIIYFFIDDRINIFSV